MYLGGLVACAVVPALANVNAASAGITLQTVSVGDAGNAPDPSTGFGQVNYAYNIGKYDVTAGQYTAFLNAVAQSDPEGLYSSSMVRTSDGFPGISQNGSQGSYTYDVLAGRDNFPVTDVSFWDATSFANWLDNGQPAGPEGAGTTATGTYTLSSNGMDNNTIARNAGATWAVASAAEWAKAAYYSPLGGGGYSLYAIQSNGISTAEANYNNAIGDTTAVGSYPFPSYYGTYDQSGDVWQWTDSVGSDPTSRVLEGGAFDSGVDLLQDGYSLNEAPVVPQDYSFGFRVSEVPEPASSATLAIGIAGMLLRRRGSRR